MSDPSKAEFNIQYDEHCTIVSPINSAVVMINIEIVKESYANTQSEKDKEFKHGTAVSMRLVEPWRGTGRTDMETPSSGQLNVQQF